MAYGGRETDDDEEAFTTALQQFEESRERLDTIQHMHFDGLVRGKRQSPRVQQQAAAAQPPPASRAAARAPVAAVPPSEGRRKQAQQHVQAFMHDSSTRLRETCSGSDRGGSRPRDEMIGRAGEVAGKTVAQALRCMVVQKGVLCQYRRQDLVYDLKMGRLGFEVLRGGEWQAVEPTNHSQGRRKQAQQQLNTFLHDSSARLRKAGSGSSAWLRKAGSARSGGVAGKTVAQALRCVDATKGAPARYRRQDLVYDLKMGRLGFETLRDGVWQAVEPV